MKRQPYPGWVGRQAIICGPNAVVLLFLERLLVREGVIVAATATAAEELLDLTVQHQPDTVILDPWLPGTDGPELLCRLRAATSACLVVFTVVASEEEEAQLWQAGADAVIPQPSDAREVLRLLHQVWQMARDSTLGAPPVVSSEAPALVGSYFSPELAAIIRRAQEACERAQEQGVHLETSRGTRSAVCEAGRCLRDRSKRLRAESVRLRMKSDGLLDRGWQSRRYPMEIGCPDPHPEILAFLDGITESGGHTS